MKHLTPRSALFAGLACAVVVVSWLLVPGSPRRTAAALALALAIPCARLAWSRPVIFSLSIYAAVIPFNDLVTGVVGSATATKCLGVIATVVLLVGLARSHATLHPRPAVMMWWLVTALSVLSGAWTLDGSRWAVLVPTFAQLVTLYTVAALYPFTPSDVRWLLGSMIAGASVAGAYGSYLYAKAIDLTDDHRLYIRGGDVYADPNQFAAALLVPFATAIALAVTSRNARVKTLLVLALPPIAGGIVVSGSRGALLAAIAAAVYLTVRLRERLQVLAAAMIAVLAALPVWPFIVTRVSLAFSTGGAGRNDIWRVAWEAFRGHWLLGAGVGGFPAAFDAARLHVRLSHPLEWHRGSHNLIVSYAVELGVVGMLLVLWAWWRTFRDAAAIEDDNSLFAARTGLEAGIIALFVASLFLDIMFRKYTWLAFIAIAAVRAAAVPRAQHAPTSRRAVIARTTSSLSSPAGIRT